MIKVTCSNHVSRVLITCPTHVFQKYVPLSSKQSRLVLTVFSFPRTHFLEPRSPVNCSYHSSKKIRQKNEFFTSVLFSANHIFGGKFENQKLLKFMSFHFAFYMGCVILKAVITCVELSVTKYCHQVLCHQPKLINSNKFETIQNVSASGLQLHATGIGSIWYDPTRSNLLISGS